MLRKRTCTICVEPACKLACPSVGLQSHAGMVMSATLHARHASRHRPCMPYKCRASSSACMAPIWHPSDQLECCVSDTVCPQELQRYAKHRPHPVFSLAARVVGGAPVGAVLAGVVAVQVDAAAAHSHSSQVVDWHACVCADRAGTLLPGMMS